MSVEARPDEICSGLGTLAEASQKEDAAIVESPAGVSPPLLGQLVMFLSPATTRCVELTQAWSLEASARQETALRMKLFLLVHVGEGTGSVEVWYEDLSTGEAGAIDTRTVYTSSQQDS